MSYFYLLFQDEQMRLLTISLLQLFIGSVFAQSRGFISFENKNNVAVFSVSDGAYRIKFISDKVAETSFVPTSDPVQPPSHAVDEKPGKSFRVRETKSEIWLNAGDLAIKVSKVPFVVSYYRKGELLFAENRGFSKTDTSHQVSLKITAEEVLYGGGTRVLGMNRRGHRLPLYHKAQFGYETHAPQMNFCLPVFLSSKRYMVHFDNPTTGFLDLDSGKKNEVIFDCYSGRKAYQVVTGESWDELTDNYTQLTGRQPLPPLWALGNFASRFGYHSQQQVMKTAEAFAQERIPVDALIVDLYWFGKEIQGTLGNLAWHKDSFPDGGKMIRDLRRKGIKTILITEPFILTTSGNWQNAVKNDVLVKDEKGKAATWDFYFGNTGLVDVFKDNGRKWFWNFYKNMISEGVAGQWGDLGEPEALPKKTWSGQGISDEFRNIYGHQWAKMIFDGYARDFPAQRPFILMRSGYSGSQKYGMIPWTGDVNRSWGGFQGQVELSLQMGMQGLAYMHSDLGGFGGANLDDELYIRWLQYGVFQPVFRPHAQEEVPSEPVFRSQKTMELAKQAIELRYRLLPYNYDMAIQNSMYGTPLMRPLFFEEPENRNLFDSDKGYFWGRQFLVYPIKTKGQTEIEVYFPRSSDWLDFYTGTRYAGGTNHRITLSEGSIPTFVKAGSFIPMTKPVRNTEEYDPTALELHFYPDDSVKKSSANFTYDDGTSVYTISEEKYTTVSCSFSGKNKNWTFKFKNKPGRGLRQKDIKSAQYRLFVHNVRAAPHKVSVNGKTVRSEFDGGKNLAIIPVTFSKGASKVDINW